MNQHRYYRFLLSLLLVGALASSAYAQQEKLAQTGMKFLSVSLDPRAAALGDAVTALEGGASMLFYNPAGVARQETFMDLTVGQTQWIADINYNQLALTLRFRRLGVFGFSLRAVDYGNIEETVWANNEQGFLDVGTISPTALSVGFAYARALTDRFSIGGQIKFVREDLGSSIVSVDAIGDFTRNDIDASVTAYDFGVIYRTGFRSLNFAFSARNFSEEISFVEQSFQLPLTLRIGVSADMFAMTGRASETHKLLLGLDAENPRDFSEQMKVGVEYLFANTLALRAGYVAPTDEQGISLGVGVQQELAGLFFAADYAYTDFGVFSNVSRLAFRIGL